MEIGPVPGIGRIAAVTARQRELRAPAVFDVDASARPGEDGAQRNGRKAAGAEENDEDKVNAEAEEASAVETEEDRGSGRVDYFA
jgi:hypothetical protein